MVKCMNKNKTVSIIVPVYNAAENLNHCINSILNLTYQHLEIILINDGSTDHSGELCDQLMRQDQRIHVIHQKNSGPSVARNNGINVATGKYIQFVDADDFPKPHMTKTLVDQMHGNCQLVICGYQSVDNHFNIIHQNTPSIHGMLLKSEFLVNFGELYKQIILPSIWNKLYITELIKTHNIHFDENLKLGEDLLFNLDYFKVCQKVNMITDKLYNYRIENDQSLSQNFKKDYFENQLLLADKVKQFLMGEHAYTAQNKHMLQLINISSVINSFDNIFHKNSPFTKEQKIDQISHIIHSKQISEVIFGESIQAKVIGFLIKHRLIHSIYLFFKAKNNLKYKMYPLFKLLKTINHKESISSLNNIDS